MRKMNDVGRVGLAYSAYVIFAVGAVFAYAFLLSCFKSWIGNRLSIVYIIGAEVLQYGVGTAVMFAVLSRKKFAPTQKSVVSLPNFIKIFCLAMFFMLLGSFAAGWVESVISLIFGIPAPEPISERLVSVYPPWLLVLSTAIIAPVAEEILFRKLIIDRLRAMGEGVAIVASAIVFGLIHGNFEQFFYAAGLGAVFAHLYLKSGTIWYSVLIHFIINTVAVLQMLLPDGASVAVSLLWMALIMVCAAFGAVFLFQNRKRLTFLKGKTFKTVFLNPGMIIFLIVCAIRFAINYI